MRQAVRLYPRGFMSGADLRITEVRCEIWREFWFVSKTTGPGAYTLDCYLTEADAIAESNKIAAAVHAASVGGDSLEVAMVPEVGAVLDPSPMVVVLHAQGTWATARIAWTHNLLGILVRRIGALVKTYVGAGEMLGPSLPHAACTVVYGHQAPSVPLPAIGVSSGAVSPIESLGVALREHEIQVELHAWVARLDNDDAYLDAARYGSALIAIAEEQRTWGGLAADTKVSPPAQITIEEGSGGGLLYHAMVVAVVSFSDLHATRTASSDEYAEGGKYAQALP